MNFHELGIEERLRLVEDIWDSIAADQESIPLTPEQREELDRRLDQYRIDKNPGEPADVVIKRIRSEL